MRRILNDEALRLAKPFLGRCETVERIRIAKGAEKREQPMTSATIMPQLKSKRGVRVDS